MGEYPMQWAANPSHLRGIPRRIVFSTIGAFAKLFTSFLNSAQVHNKETLLKLVTSRPPGTSLLTVSNHMSTLDDPLMWGFQGFPVSNPKLIRWILAADDICFTNPIYSYFFRLGKCIPITRGAGIYQPQMNEALDHINGGEWLHTFPEGKINQGPEPLRRLKWGIGSLVVRANVPTIVLPIAHSGFEKVMPEKYMFERRPLLPLAWKKVSIVVGEPIQFDIGSLKQSANLMPVDSCNTSSALATSILGKNALTHSAKSCTRFVGDLHTSAKREKVMLDETRLKWVYRQITEQIQVVLQELSRKARALNSTTS